ncbi:MAG: HAMP domain-containing sensor histidine kinase [Desulfuromonadales bacterium]|nr:HAMP domain-containing sensor histidine kinase [Desulfuromonadales bacterium]
MEKASLSLYTRTALRTVLYYVILGALWISLSDQLTAWLFPAAELQSTAQTVKGWLFVLMTGGLLFVYLHHCLRKMHGIEEQARQTTSEQTRQLAALFDSFNAVIYVADVETYELLYINPYARKAFGPEWQGTACYHYLQQGRSTPCDFCTNPQLLKEGVDGPALIWEFQNTRNGRWYECLDKIIRWDNNRLARLEIALDISERKEMERTREELLSTVSHEMRTPLTAISGFSELLLDEKDLPPHIVEHLQIIAHESEKLDQLIETFLDLRRIKTDRARIGYEPIEADELLNAGSADCRDCHAGHNIKVDCADGLHIFGNRKELSRVINQLINNACRFSPGGGTVLVSAVRDHDNVLFRIQDNGPGIPPEEQEKIFVPFYRLDTGDSRSVRGTGLGLSLAKEVVELHGGRIWVDSQLDRGSCFSISLPEYRSSNPSNSSAVKNG